MKLYTEKELRKAIGKSRLSDGFVDGVFQLKYTIDEVLEQSLPIELPSNEQIEELSKNTNFEHDYFNHGFVRGAEWVKEQILKQKQ